MKAMIFTDIVTILTFYGVFALAYLSNVVFSLYRNINYFNEPFDKKKLLQGILKCLVFVIGSILLVLAIDFATYVFNKYGIISEVASELVTIGSMILTIGSAIVIYIKEAITKFIDILTIEK